MKTFSIFAHSPWAQALGWTFVHSLWQSLLIYLLCQIALRTLARNATHRYLLATVGIATMFTTALATFVYLIEAYATETFISIPLRVAPVHMISQEGQPVETTWLAYLESNISLLTLFWIVGAIICSLRLIGSWWYVSRIQMNATPLDEPFIAPLEDLIRRLNIKQRVRLASSTYLTAPAVIGWLRPTILVPIGFLSGLSTQQIETILVHELMHIKRHDYLVNLVQSWIECVLFFNPFVWMISAIIRTEREHCCDDAVIAMGDARVYALTLAQLEARRLATAGIAIGLAENKHQLLNRIKRIMEKSVRNYSGREKLIPVVLLITGLACASWITLQSQEKAPASKSVAPADTTGKKNNGKSYTTQHVHTIDANGDAHEETVEVFDDNFPVEPMIDVMPALAPIPDIAVDGLPFPPMPPADLMLSFDTIPPFAFAAPDWEAFSKAFEGKFKEQFEDFYKKNQKDFDKMMKELEGKFKEGGAFDAELRAAMAMHADQMKNHAEAAALHAEAMAMREKALAEHTEKMDGFRKEMDNFEKEHTLRAKELEAMSKRMEENMKRYESELRQELVRDGYIKKEEKIENIHWQDGEMRVNDIKIKKEHLQKYDDLHKKFFKEEGEMHYVH